MNVFFHRQSVNSTQFSLVSTRFDYVVDFNSPLSSTLSKNWINFNLCNTVPSENVVISTFGWQRGTTRRRLNDFKIPAVIEMRKTKSLLRKHEWQERKNGFNLPFRRKNKRKIWSNAKQCDRPDCLPQWKCANNNSVMRFNMKIFFRGGEGDDKKPYAIIGRHLPLNNSICQRNDNDSIFMCNFIIIDARDREREWECVKRGSRISNGWRR